MTLEKSYSFDDIAEISTQRRGARIIGRSLQSYYTRKKNLRVKVKKSKGVGAAKKAISPSASQPKVSRSDEDSEFNIAEVSPYLPPQSKTTATDSGAFPSEIAENHPKKVRQSAPEGQQKRILPNLGCLSATGRMLWDENSSVFLSQHQRRHSALRFSWDARPEKFQRGGHNNAALP